MGTALPGCDERVEGRLGPAEDTEVSSRIGLGAGGHIRPADHHHLAGGLHGGDGGQRLLALGQHSADEDHIRPFQIGGVQRSGVQIA